MPEVEVVFLPHDLASHQITDRAVAVFDVLRATTSITAALAAGVAEVRVFGETQEAADAAVLHGEGKLLCGEVRCLPPPGFDLGNSPGAFKAELHRDRIAFMSTTNGTKAIIAARAATVLLTAALVNATAAARVLGESGRDVTLLCAGSGGEIAMEDVIGAGAVLDALRGYELSNDAARMALRLFRDHRHDLREVLRDTRGGKNIIAAGLGEDIDFCAKLDSFDVVGKVSDDPLRVLAPQF